MRIVFSRHALAQLKERNLSKRIVEKVVRKSRHLTEQRLKRYRAMSIVERRRKQYLLVIIYDQKNSTKEIITAYLTSKLKKYL